ncbi:hypothetical protein FQA39_LY00938 [Lamprigera yunnana]|nr:hypothetical protein FQA39_LY00938 [Lamprigera yunnana]
MLIVLTCVSDKMSKVIHSQGRELIFNVYKYMQEEKERQELTVPFNNLQARVAAATGVAVYKLERSPQANKFRSPWAIKKVLKEHLNHTQYGKRLCKEAEILRTLDHPHIIGFRAFKKNCLAMEECNKSLGDMIEERSSEGQSCYPAENIMKVALDISCALNYLHTQAFLLHGDVKSFNILIKGNFEICKLCDFGVSLPITANNEVDYTKTGNIDEYPGTRLWAAPEILEYPLKITTKVDMYAYGLVLWEMLALQPPCVEALSDESLSEDFNESIIFGKRPDLPDDNYDSSYKYVLEMFYCCTEEDLNLRPSALDLVISIPEMMKELGI